MSVTTETPPQAPPAPVEDPEAPFGPNEMRLGKRQWIFFFLIVVSIFVFLPRVWSVAERFDTGPDYRVPYELSNDYWQIGRWFAQKPGIAVIGDSVIWGEYVSPDGTLTHFLNAESGGQNFSNCGVNGFFPLALEGLINNYGGALRGQKVLLECDVLWMTSPKADLSSKRIEPFNHSRLVPQFSPKIPCYEADMNERLGAVIERNVGFLSWVSHIQISYFGQKSLTQWTLADDGNSPPNFPNLWRNPISQIAMRVPAAPASDPERGPSSPRHVPWFKSDKEPLRYEWVPLEKSLQWQAFRRTAATLQARGNDVYVLLVPFNEHMIAPDNRAPWRSMVKDIDTWLSQKQIPHQAPPTLPGELYADASHPLTEGYRALAKTVCAQPDFQQWLKNRR